jgi:tetratricopeptide (TPR) repeat protein
MKVSITILLALMLTGHAYAQLQPSGPLGGSGAADQRSGYPYSRNRYATPSPQQFPGRILSTPYPAVSATPAARNKAQTNPQEVIARCIAAVDAFDVATSPANYVEKTFDVCGFIKQASGAYTLAGGKNELLQKRATSGSILCYVGNDLTAKRLMESLMQDRFNLHPFALLKVKIIKQETPPQYAAIIEEGSVLQPLLLSPLKRQLGMSLQERQKEAELAKAQQQQTEIARMKETADMKVAVAEENAKAKKFQARASTLFGNFLDDPSWEGRSEDLRKNTRLSPALKDQITELTEGGKNLLAALKYPDSRSQCEKALTLLEAPAVWALAAEAYASGEATKGTAALQDFISRHSGAEVGAFMGSLQTFYKTCREREGAAQSHLQRAKELSARGKNAQAVKEYEMAQSLYPDQETLRIIEKLRKESLGL